MSKQKEGNQFLNLEYSDLERGLRWDVLISSLDFGLVKKKNPTSRFRSEASTYGLACSDDVDNHNGVLFSLQNVVYLQEYTRILGLHFE